MFMLVTRLAIVGVLKRLIWLVLVEMTVASNVEFKESSSNPKKVFSCAAKKNFFFHSFCPQTTKLLNIARNSSKYRNTNEARLCVQTRVILSRDSFYLALHIEPITRPGCKAFEFLENLLNFLILSAVNYQFRVRSRTLPWLRAGGCCSNYTEIHTISKLRWLLKGSLCAVEMNQN